MYGTFHTLRKRGWRDWLGALALFGLLVRAAVPVGFMPSPLYGELQLVLCSVADIDDAAHGHLPHGGSNNPPCPFAATGAGITPSPMAAATWPVLLTLSRPASAYRSTPDAAPPRHTAARGPPASI